MSACGSSGIPANAVIKVGDNAVTKSTFNHWLSVAAESSSTAAPGQAAPKPVIPDPPSYTACITHLQATAPKPAKGQPKPTATQFKAQCAQQYTALKQQVLGFLISSNWVLGEAADQGISVTDAAVQKQFNQVKQQQYPKAADFQKFLDSSGQTVSDLLLRVKLNLLSSKIQQKITKSKSNVTQAQIASYYNKNKQRFGQPERRSLLLILTKGQAAAQKAKQDIQSGQSFKSVAKRVSIDQASKAQGGALPGVVKGQEQKALDAAVFSAKANVLSGPIKTPFGYYVFKVTKITPASQQTLAQAQSSVKQQLVAQNQQTALSTFVKGFQKKWTAKTECRKDYLVMNCKGYKAPKTPTAAPTGATPVPQGGTTTPPQTTTPSSTKTG
ncbi:MAG TPA: peptidyl-prolyl cis-trans isomerase [Solirubrobacteraceae bacterium]|nr:peptidyl-prolyl cis-trans isomerase [Solirubrobacteraceae bacterium]